MRRAARRGGRLGIASQLHGNTATGLERRAKTAGKRKPVPCWMLGTAYRMLFVLPYQLVECTVWLVSSGRIFVSVWQFSLHESLVLGRNCRSLWLMVREFLVIGAGIFGYWRGHFWLVAREVAGVFGSQ